MKKVLKEKLVIISIFLAVVSTSIYKCVMKDFAEYPHAICAIFFIFYYFIFQYISQKFKSTKKCTLIKYDKGYLVYHLFGDVSNGDLCYDLLKNKKVVCKDINLLKRACVRKIIAINNETDIDYNKDFNIPKINNSVINKMEKNNLNWMVVNILCDNDGNNYVENGEIKVQGFLNV